MVRHGRLSKGCQTCRKRKIRGRPACSQCRKAGWECPQYGDCVERMFQYHGVKDLTAGGSLHARKQEVVSSSRASSRGPSGPGECAFGYGAQGVDVGTAQRSDAGIMNFAVEPKLSKAISIPIRDCAIEYFLSAHVFRESGAGGLRGYYEYLSDYNNHLRDKELGASLNAVALASYAHVSRHLDLLEDARRHYGNALQLVNRALHSRSDAVKDSTMVSILLLNTFEAISSEDETSLAYSDSHMRGVMMVINLRGCESMHSRRGLQIFLHMCRCLVVHCIIRSVRVPRDLVKLRKYAGSLLDRSDPTWRMEDILVEMAAFCADVKSHLLVGSQSIIDVALGIDDKLSSLAGNMPPEWQFGTVHTSEESPTVLGSHYHVYPDLWVAFVWNYIRTCRLLLHQEIQTQLTRVLSSPAPLSPPRLRSIAQYSRATWTQMRSEICASIPQYCSHLSASTESARQEDEHDGKPPSTQHMLVTHLRYSDSIPAAAAVYFLIWPLFAVGQTSQCSRERAWIVDRARFIGKTSGIQRALTIADIIQSAGLFPSVDSLLDVG